MREFIVSVSKACEGDERQTLQRHILVGVNDCHSELRVNVLLNTLPEYKIDIITPECNIGDLMEDADLVIGSKSVAREGVLRQKPVIIIGTYGSGGLLTPDTVAEHYRNGFIGKIGGKQNEYFSLDQLQHDIEKSFSLTFQELGFMCNQMNRLLSHIDF